MAKAWHFQVMLKGNWQDYTGNEDKILKRAYLAGFPNAKYTMRGHSYHVDFGRMTQKNLKSGNTREIRPPYTWKAPAAPIVKPGATFVVKVPPGGPGSIIQVPHPNLKGQMVAVNVPATAKVGQAMLVPMPTGAPAPVTVVEPSAAEAAALVAEKDEGEKAKKKKDWSTGAKVAGVAAVGGVAVAGAVLGEHIASEGWDETMADLGEMSKEAGESLAPATDLVEDAGAWVGDAGCEVADFVMDLF